VWFEDRKRAQEVKLPEDLVYRSQTELALELIDQMLRWEVPRMPVVADSAYGNSFDFREQLRQRQLSYVLAVEPPTVVWTQDPHDRGPAIARLGVEESDLACGNARPAAVAFRQAESLGGTRMAGAGAS
jgi:SRSO17 transposase